MSSDAIFAEPMLDGEEYLKKYAKQLNALRQQGMLPDLEAELDYKVYSIRGKEFGAHKSIVLTTNDEKFVTVELGFITVDGKRHIYPVTRALDSSNKSKLQYHGTITISGGKLIARAIATMKKFGGYFKFCKNCQNFCNMYLEAVGLEKAQNLTDSDKATLVTLAGGILTLLLILLSR